MIRAGDPVVVDPVVAVEPRSPVTHLNQPGPDVLRACLDGDGARRVERRVRVDRVARHGATDLLIRGTPRQVPGADYEEVGANERHEGNCPAEQ